MALKVDPAVERPSFLLSLYWIGYAADAEPGHVAYLWTSVPTAISRQSRSR